jgi:hypothetical protein
VCKGNSFRTQYKDNYCKKKYLASDLVGTPKRTIGAMRRYFVRREASITKMRIMYNTLSLPKLAIVNNPKISDYIP